MQTVIAKAIVSTLSERIDGDIQFEKIHFRPFTTLILKNAVIIDKNPVKDPVNPNASVVDTLFSAEYIIAKFSLESLLANEGIHLHKAYVNNARMNLVIEDNQDMQEDSVTVNLTRMFGLENSEGSKPSEKEIFLIKKVELRNMQFIMKNYSSSKTPYYGGINWNDMVVRDINVMARNLRFKGGVMSGIADKVSFREKSGFVCNSISSTDVKVGNGKTIIKELRMDDGMSDLYLPLFMMSYENAEAFSDYINNVRMDAQISKSILDFRTICYFAPQLEGNELRLALSGKASGYVKDFQIEGIKASSSSGGFSGTISGKMTGLPDIEKTTMDMKVSNFHLTADGLGKFISEWMTEGELDLHKFAKGSIFMIEAKANGLLNHLHVDADVNSMTGRLNANTTLHNLTDIHKPIEINGQINTVDLDLGSILGTKIIRQTTLRTGLTAKFGTGRIEAGIDSLIIDRLLLNGYNYSGIAATGELSKDIFNGRIICNDPSLNFLFQGSVALSSKTRNTLYRFYANIGHADLNAMNIDKRGKSKVRLQTNANFTRTNNGQMLGSVDFGGIVLENKLGKHEIGDIRVASHSKDSLYRMKINSNFLDGTFTGTASITQFIKELTDITTRRELPALFKDSTYTWQGNSYSLGLKFHNMMDLLSFAVPGAYIADQTSINAEVDKDGHLDVILKSPRIAFKEQYIKDMEAQFCNREGSLTGELTSQEISAASLILSDNRLMLFADNNHIGLGYTYENKGELINRGEIIVNSDLERINDKVGMDIKILPSTVYLNSKEWNLQSSQITVLGKEINVPSLEITSSEEAIRLSGKTSDIRKDTLTLNLNRFDISIINSLLGTDFGFKGAATGAVQLISPLSEKGILADMICDSTYIASLPVGVIQIGSKWNEDFERFDFGLRNDLEGRSSIKVTGNLSPKHKLINANATFDRFNAGYAAPFLKDIFTRMEGYISGEVTVDGPLSSLSLSSNDTRIDDALLRIGYTNTAYHAQGPFHLDSEGAHFDNIAIRDDKTGTGTVSGGILWDYFKDIRFDTWVNVRDMECININEKEADVFYGNIFATGKLHISGPMTALQMDIDATTTKPGHLNIPISASTTGGSTTDLLKFTEPFVQVKVDPYEEMIKRLKKQKNTESALGVNLNVNATQDVEAFIEIDKASGNVLSGRGNGNINLEVSNDVFSIKGDYRLTDGKYKFSALGIVNRDFQIQDGSTVNFTGDIMDSRLDINAIYRTKASLSRLISDTSSVANRRNVECGIKISDKIMSPKVDFSINIPDLDPTVKSRVESALSTEDKVQKQFLSLLITNNFMQDDQSGIVNNMYGNVGDIMANQINNILQKLDIPLDLGLKYQPNDKGVDIFDVAISTQLFNNRVIVNGNIGNRQKTSSSANDVAGDIEIEIKIDRAGAFRLNLFSHAADQYTNTLDNSQRSGIGLTYQTEFNTFGQFIRKLFSSKEKRQEMKLEEERMQFEGEKTVINISGNEKETKRKNGRK